MDHFPTNWGRPVGYHIFRVQLLLSILLSATMPSIRTAHTLSTNGQLQRTRLRRACNGHSMFVSHRYSANSHCYQTTHCDWYLRARHPVQGWYYDGCRQPRCALSPHYLLTLFERPSTASYGSLARFKDIRRLHAVGTSTVIGASGDMSDFQAIQALLDEIVTDEFTHTDGHDLGPAEVHEYLSRVMYSRRSKIDPLWNSILVGGFRDGKRYVRTSIHHVSSPPYGRIKRCL